MKFPHQFLEKHCGTLALALLIIAASPAWAVLGGAAASVQSDQIAMHGTLQTTPASSYTLQQIKTASGTLVREYVSPAGTVFAVAWQGPWPPDLRQLLGSYFQQYQQAVQAQTNAHPGRHPRIIQLPGLVVEMGGHMRAFIGRAYVPGMLPENVQSKEIR